MANVNIKFNNKDYLLSCDDGQEENLKKLAEHLDLKYSGLKKNLGNIGENKLLLITSIQMIDDYFELFNKLNKTKNEFEKLSTKFKELRSLAINYKDKKEQEIENIKDELNKFEKKIEENKTSYEETIDKTTKSIEQFIESAENNKKKNIQ
jgi:cell division protein ZapA